MKINKSVVSNLLKLINLPTGHNVFNQLAISDSGYIRRLFLTLFLLVPHASHAADLSINGFTLNSSTHIVSGNGLEWLQWSETLGLTPNQAIALYGPYGWRVATNQEVADLFNSFKIGGSTEWIDNEDIRQNHHTTYSPGDTTAETELISMFGETDRYESSERFWFSTAASFGGDADGDGYMNRVGAGVSWSAAGDFTYSGANIWGDITVDDEGHWEGYGMNDGGDRIGVILVRPKHPPTGIVSLNHPSGMAVFEVPRRSKPWEPDTCKLQLVIEQPMVSYNREPTSAILTYGFPKKPNAYIVDTCDSDVGQVVAARSGTKKSERIGGDHQVYFDASVKFLNADLGHGLRLDSAQMKGLFPVDDSNYDAQGEVINLVQGRASVAKVCFSRWKKHKGSSTKTGTFCLTNKDGDAFLFASDHPIE